MKTIKISIESTSTKKAYIIMKYGSSPARGKSSNPHEVYLNKGKAIKAVKELNKKAKKKIYKYVSVSLIK